MCRFVSSLLLLLAVTTSVLAEDWPQWMGPNRNGLNEQTGTLQEWPEGGPTQEWVFKDCGTGYSGPAIVDGKIYVMGGRDGVEQLIALNAKNGKELWSADLGELYTNGWGDGPRGTPTIDGNKIYALAAKGDLVCCSLKRGKELWRVSFTELGGKIPVWGYSESPLVDGDLVIATPGNDQGAIAAFDKNSGELVWRTESLTNVAHYSSVIATQIHGKKQYIQLLDTLLVGLNPEDGSILWETPWAGKVAVIPTPLVKDNQVYVTSGYGTGCMLVDLSPENEATVVYQNKVIKNHHGGVIRLGDFVFGHSDKGGWTCQDWATGERLWRERSALGKGAVNYADGRFYCLSEGSGEVVLVEPSTEGWEERGRFTLEPQSEIRKPKGKIWMHPVVVDGHLYLRDQELFYCFDVTSD